MFTKLLKRLTAVVAGGLMGLGLCRYRRIVLVLNGEQGPLVGLLVNHHGDLARRPVFSGPETLRGDHPKTDGDTHQECQGSRLGGNTQKGINFGAGSLENVWTPEMEWDCRKFESQANCDH